MKTIIESNGSKWMGEAPDNIEVLKERLKEYTLSPNNAPYIQEAHEIEFIKPCPELEGMAHFSGNFWEISLVFSIYTNDTKLIEELKNLISLNVSGEKYTSAVEQWKSSYWNQDLYGVKKQA